MGLPLPCRRCTLFVLNMVLRCAAGEGGRWASLIPSCLPPNPRDADRQAASSRQGTGQRGAGREGAGGGLADAAPASAASPCRSEEELPAPRWGPGHLPCSHPAGPRERGAATHVYHKEAPADFYPLPQKTRVQRSRRGDPRKRRDTQHQDLPRRGGS